MNFHSPDYVVFLLLVVALYYLLAQRGWQNALLVGASALFYGYVHPWFLWLLAAVVGAAYLATRVMEARPALGRLALWGAALVCMGLLGVFKYFNFFLDNINGLLRSGGLGELPWTLQLLLPVGISFYTFQAVAYVADVYAGRARAEHNPINLALFLSFFPQLVAGPIERAHHLLRQVQTPRRFRFENLVEGTTLALWGFFKKLVIGDNMAVVANKIFLLGDPGPALLSVGVLAFGVQIYADFSGYTDIARGSARLLGFDLCENFRHPYIAQSPADFWRRWHISLSQWVRDYIYFPLGGSRVSRPREVANVLITMFLCGLWHGAAWNFAVWGLYHGLLIVAYRLLEWRGMVFSGGSVWLQGLRVLVMFFLVHVGWALFREPDLAWLVHNANPFVPHAHAEPRVAAYLLLLTCLYALPLYLHAWLDRWDWQPRVAWRISDWMLRTGFATACLAASLVLGATVTTDFIYFQF
ncbi:MAG: MBOAT family protein [Gammaproteobacteria bacterium]|nr:MBOAT family protein [Gammaproteobacteria bacterium]